MRYQKGPPRIVDCVEAEQVTVAKRKRMVKELQAAAGEIKCAEDESVRQAQLAIMRALPQWHVLQRTPRSHAELPFPTARSHVVVLCGGYVGCVTCGHISGYSATKAMAAPCGLHLPKGGYRRKATARLLARKLPHATASRPGVAAEWPSGEDNPSLLLVGRGMLSESDWLLEPLPPGSSRGGVCWCRLPSALQGSQLPRLVLFSHAC